MKISLSWLGDYIDWIETDPQKIADRITTGAAEVEEILDPGALLNGCCVGKVLTLSKHPNADKLSLCTVQTDKGEKKVVCGGTNLREGMRVAFAPVGARVRWHGEEMMTLEKVKIRGEESEGMICAAEELGIEAQFPATPEQGKSAIVDFGDGNEGVGKPLKEFLNANDVVLHVDNHAITHRADLFSHIGFARECVALGLAKWKKKPECTAPKFGKGSGSFAFKADDAELMPRYFGCFLEIESLGETPDWMKARLESIGLRSLNLPVDITNYVANEIGVPLHSFDADDIKGDVHMRASKKGETIVTLDNVERKLPDGAIVLSDDEGIFDLLGIMGGLRSSTKASTKKIYVHSATLDTKAIRKAMIATGHRTDAGTTYEKGVSPYIAEQGFYRALELFLELVPGAKIVSSLGTHGKTETPPSITTDHAYLVRMLGADIATKDISKILTDLGCTVSEKKGVFIVTPPLWRTDLNGPHDLVEEVGRIYGFDAIADALPSASTEPPKRDMRMNTMRQSLKESTFFELVPLSLVGSTLLKKAGADVSSIVSVENALGEEYSLLHPSTVPSLLEHAQENLLNVEEELRTFTSGHVFAEGKPEVHELGLLIMRREESDLKTDPFLTLKQVLKEMGGAANYALLCSPTKNIPENAHPGRIADVVCNGTVVGQIFEVHPSIRAKFDLPHRTAAARINLDALFAIDPLVRTAQSLSQFPAVSYDVTVKRTQNHVLSDALNKAAKASELLEDIAVVDLYSGKPLNNGEYNLTLRCTYRADDRTLTEKEAKEAHEKVLATLS